MKMTRRAQALLKIVVLHFKSNPLFNPPSLQVQRFERELDEFVESTYYKAEGVFFVRIAQMIMAMEGIGTDRVLWLGGHGGNGKGMEFLLEKNFFTPMNCAAGRTP